MARFFQELKLNFDREEQIAGHTSHRFNLLMRTNSCRKIIGIYFNGYTMTNTKHWALYYCRYRAMKILNKKNTRIILKSIHRHFRTRSSIISFEKSQHVGYCVQ